MSEPPDRPKIYHITHVDNLSSILAAGGLESDARRLAQEAGHTTISWGHVYIIALCINEEEIKIVEGKKETVQ